MIIIPIKKTDPQVWIGFLLHGRSTHNDIIGAAGFCNIESVVFIGFGIQLRHDSDIKEVLDLALTEEKVHGAIDFCAEMNKKEEKK